MIQGIVKPLIPPTVRAVPSLRQFADALRLANNPIVANAFERTQQALDLHDKALRNAPDQTEEFVFTDSTGAMIAWLGSREGFWGGWFGQLYVGSDGPDTAPFFVDASGVVSIGKNGYVQLLDPGGGVVGWLGCDVETPKTITGATNADPVVVTIAAHGYEDGDTVYIQGATGNTAINGYRIVQAATTNTFEITDLEGVDIAGNGAFAGTATATRYFGGGLFETMAIGGTFPDYKLRAFADGSLKIKDALITLSDGDKSITLDPTGPQFVFRDDGSDFTITGLGASSHLIRLTMSAFTDDGRKTVEINSEGEIELIGYSKEASIDVLNYGRASQLSLRASGGTVETPSAISGEAARINLSAYDGGTPIGHASMDLEMVATSPVMKFLLDDVEIMSVVADGLYIPNGTIQFNGAGFTASTPLKLDGTQSMIAGKIDLGNSDDIQFSGGATDALVSWDGSTLVSVTIAALATALSGYFATATHTHNVSGETSTNGDPAHSHTYSSSTTGPIG
jgi:hypothetical protein